MEDDAAHGINNKRNRNAKANPSLRMRPSPSKEFVGKSHQAQYYEDELQP